jgi:cell surface protein SprA
MVGVKAMKRIRTGRSLVQRTSLSDMDNQGGMAAVLNVDSNLADFATISATGKSTGFGLEQGPNERNREYSTIQHRNKC